MNDGLIIVLGLFAIFAALSIPIIDKARRKKKS